MSQAAGCEALAQFWRAPVKVTVQVLNWALKRSVVLIAGLMPVDIAPPDQVVVDVWSGPGIVPPPVVGAGMGNPDWR